MNAYLRGYWKFVISSSTVGCASNFAFTLSKALFTLSISVARSTQISLSTKLQIRAVIQAKHGKYFSKYNWSKYISWTCIQIQFKHMNQLAKACFANLFWYTNRYLFGQNNFVVTYYDLFDVWAFLVNWFTKIKFKIWVQTNKINKLILKDSGCCLAIIKKLEWTWTTYQNILHC